MGGRELLAKTRMMRASGINPSGGGGFQIRFRNPQRACDGQVGEWFLGWDHLYGIHNHAKAIAHINDGRIECRTTACVKDQTHRVCFAADAEWMNFKGWLVLCNCR